MNIQEHEYCLLHLKTLIGEIMATIERAEAHSLEGRHAADYATLLDLLEKARAQQRSHQAAILALTDRPAPTERAVLTH